MSDIKPNQYFKVRTVNQLILKLQEIVKTRKIDNNVSGFCWNGWDDHSLIVNINDSETITIEPEAKYEI